MKWVGVGLKCNTGLYTHSSCGQLTEVTQNDRMGYTVQTEAILGGKTELLVHVNHIGNRHCICVFV